MISQVLINEETGKSFGISLEGKNLTITSGKRVTEETYDSEAKALLEFQKKKWEQLKKGFVFKTEELEKGTAHFHRYIGKEYTGCLSLVQLDSNVGVYKHNDFKNEFIQVFDSKGTFIETIEKIGGLPWFLKFSKKYNTLYLTMDHLVAALDLSTREFSLFTNSSDLPASFISLSNDHLLYGSNSMVYLKSLKTNEIGFSKKVESEMYSGHSPQFHGGISRDGTLIALCSKSGELNILDNTGHLIKVITGDFEMVTNIEFIDNNTLLIQEQYGTHGLRLFELDSGKELPNPFTRHPYEGTLVDSFDINWEDNKILVVCRNTATLYDLTSFNQLQQFEFEHCIKKGQAIFFGDSTIAVRTDYGCFSLYHV